MKLWGNPSLSRVYINRLGGDRVAITAIIEDENDSEPNGSARGMSDVDPIVWIKYPQHIQLGID